jgi:hypothetical protein
MNKMKIEIWLEQGMVKGWLWFATSEANPQGWDAPQGPFETFDECFADLKTALDWMAEEFNQELSQPAA